MRSRTALASLTQPARAARCCSSARGMRAVATTAPAPGSTSATFCRSSQRCATKSARSASSSAAASTTLDRRIEIRRHVELGDRAPSRSPPAERRDELVDRRPARLGSRRRPRSTTSSNDVRHLGVRARRRRVGRRLYARDHLVQERGEREEVAGARLLGAPAPDSRAMPKLTSLTAWCSPRATRPTLRATSSPCTTPSACAAASAAPISSAMGSASSSDRRPRASSSVLSERPATHSTTRKGGRRRARRSRGSRRRARGAAD